MIRKFLEKIFKKRSKKTPEKHPWPTREEIALLPWFDGLGLNDIIVVNSKESAEQAFAELKTLKVVGFDTESKPTFIKGQKPTGPHVMQFSTLRRAYVFILRQPDCRKVASALVELASLKKVGFGLDDDKKKMTERFHMHPRSVYDLESLFAEKHYGRGVGVKVGVAIVFRRRFRKSRSASTSNWAAPTLSEKQLLYAANDAFAAMKVFHTFG